MANHFSAALADMRQTARLRAVWTALASENINDQHKRTLLGPVWMLVNYLLFISVFLVVFQRGDGSTQFAGYMAVGLLVWFFISEALMQGTSLFEDEQSFIKGTPLPLFVYVMRLTVQSLIRACYGLVGCSLVLAFAGTQISLFGAWSLLGVLIIVAAAPAAITIFAFAGVFFPDLRFVMQNLMRIGMFLTPIFWGVEGVSGMRGALYHYNPFTYFVEIVRQPLIFNEFPVFAFVFCGSITIAMWVLSIYVLGKFRKSVAMVL